jgi:hypothetical protein
VKEDIALDEFVPEANTSGNLDPAKLNPAIPAYLRNFRLLFFIF